MRFGIISVGICEHAYGPNRWGTGEILYADRDAEAVEKALTKSFSDHDNAGTHLLLNSKATLGGIGSAFCSFGTIEPLDVLIVFLAGHGFKRTPKPREEVFFCVADGSPALPGLNSTSLGDLLKPIQAGRILLMLDCCFAQGFFSGFEAFNELPKDATARIWIAAAGQMEQSWEDTEARHSVFAQEVLATLASGSETDVGIIPKRWIDVVADLFPRVAKNVPIRAAQSAPLREQHPVLGGIFSDRLLLPVPSTLGVDRQITPLIAFRRLAKASLLIALIAVLGTGAFVQTSRYHLVQGANGNIVVRRGIASTDFLTPGKLGVLVDTAFGPTSLAAQDSALAPLRSGLVRGWWLPLNSRGYRTWSQNVPQFLTTESACRTELYLNGSLSAELVKLLNSDGDAWLVELASEAVLLNSNVPPWAVFAGFPSILKADSGSTNAQVLDFTILFLAYAAVENYAHAASNLAALNDDLAVQGLHRLLEIVAHRADNPGRDIDIRREARLLTEVMTAVKARRALLGKPALQDDERRGFESINTSAGRKLRLVCLAAAGGGLDARSQKAVRSELLQQLDSFDLNKQGTALSEWHYVAADALASQIKEGCAIDRESIECIERLGNAFGEILLLPAEITESLVQAAKRDELPADLSNRFMRSLTLPVESNGPAIFPLMRIIASQAGHLDKRSQARVLQEIERITKELSTADKILPLCAEPFGILAAQGITDDYVLETISRQIRPKPYLDRPTSGEDPRITIKGDDGAAFAVALGMIAQGQTLKSSSVQLLWQAALNRGDLKNYPSIIAGLASQYRQPLTSAADVRDFISPHAKSFPERRVATDVMCFRTRSVPRTETSRKLIQSLRSACDVEEEPEMRVALRRILLALITHDDFLWRTGE